MRETQPTIKQKKVFKAVVNGGKTISGAMRQAGYAISTSKKTDKVTRTKGWEMLLKQHLPDSLLAKRHRELLNKREVHVIKKRNGEEEVEVIDQPETQAVSKALDLAYKLKGSYAPEQKDIRKIVVNINPERKKQSDMIINDLLALDDGKGKGGAKN